MTDYFVAATSANLHSRLREKTSDISDYVGNKLIFTIIYKPFLGLPSTPTIVSTKLPKSYATTGETTYRFSFSI